MRKLLLLSSILFCLFTLGCEKTSVEAPGATTADTGGLGEENPDGGGNNGGGNNGGGNNGGGNNGGGNNGGGNNGGGNNGGGNNGGGNNGGGNNGGGDNGGGDNGGGNGGGGNNGGGDNGGGDNGGGDNGGGDNGGGDNGGGDNGGGDNGGGDNGGGDNGGGDNGGDNGGGDNGGGNNGGGDNGGGNNGGGDNGGGDNGGGDNGGGDNGGGDNGGGDNGGGDNGGGDNGGGDNGGGDNGGGDNGGGDNGGGDNGGGDNGGGDNGGGDNGGGDNNGNGVGDGVADITKPTQWPDFPWDGKHANAGKWNDYTYDAIDATGLNLVDNNPTDIADYCPNYPNLDETGKAMFWIGLLSSMGKYTSNWDPKTEFQEPFNDSNGNPAVSRGLMQIDYERAKNLGCNISSGTQLFGENTNLKCAVRIMNHWVGNDKVVGSKVNGSWRGGARFWGAMQNLSASKGIKDMTKSLAFCK